MTREEVLEKYVSPTMRLEQAVRWIRFGLPPLQTLGLERTYLYDDVILREFEDIPIPEHIDPWPHYRREKAILVQALHKGDFVAWGVRDEINWDGFLESVGIQWFRYPPRPGDWFPMPAEMWKWSKEFNLTQSRVSFHDAEYFCGPDWCQDIYVYTEDMMRIFPREKCAFREFIQPENDVFRDVEGLAVRCFRQMGAEGGYALKKTEDENPAPKATVPKPKRGAPKKIADNIKQEIIEKVAEQCFLGCRNWVIIDKLRKEIESRGLPSYSDEWLRRDWVKKVKSRLIGINN